MRALFYINTNNGYTKLEDGTKINKKQIEYCYSIVVNLTAQLHVPTNAQNEYQY